MTAAAAEWRGSVWSGLAVLQMHWSYAVRTGSPLRMHHWWQVMFLARAERTTETTLSRIEATAAPQSRTGQPSPTRSNRLNSSECIHAHSWPNWSKQALCRDEVSRRPFGHTRALKTGTSQKLYLYLLIYGIGRVRAWANGIGWCTRTRDMQVCVGSRHAPTAHTRRHLSHSSPADEQQLLPRSWERCYRR